MLVGINYPWLNYAWDFGEPPPGWGARARWRTVIADHLARFREIGVRALRWFVVGDGLLYGTGASAPARDGSPFDPPRVAQAVLDDFGALLDVLHESGIMLIPVLLDFHFAKDAVETNASGFVQGGRGSALSDPDRRRRLLSRLLAPLLERCNARRDVIYAWELINEPEGCTETGASDRGEFPRVRLPDMIDFLREGTRMIHDSGFVPTIGYRYPATPLRWSSIEAHRRRTGTMRRIDPLASSRPFGEGYWQFHYYPADRSPIGFPSASSITAQHDAVILGELATLAGRDRWPDLGRDQSLRARLRFAADRGVALALPWSFRAKLRADGAWTGPDATNAAATDRGEDRAEPDWNLVADEIRAFNAP